MNELTNPAKASPANDGAKDSMTGTLRTPPHSMPLEQAILAALLSVANSLEEVGDSLLESDFYAPRHRLIYKAIVSLAAINQPYDAVMVLQWLSEQKMVTESGGEQYLSNLLDESPASLFNLSTYAAKVKDLASLRELIGVGNDMLKTAYDPQNQSASDILDSVESRVFAINEKLHANAVDNGPQVINSVLKKVLAKVEDLHARGVSITGIPTGFLELDNQTAGMQNGDLIIVAARPSMGKTTFAMNLVESVLFNCPLPALVFSMEMPADALGMRLVSAFGKIDQSKLRTGKLDDSDWARFGSALAQLNTKHLYIDDSSALPPNELRARARRIAKAHGGLGCIMVDYLQLMKVPGMGDNRVGEISEISRNLKALAKEMNCPVIALSQLNRALENRPNKRPVMSDLRESGAIEQDADVIMFIYRDEVYSKEQCKEPGIAEIIIGKQRNGPIGTVRLHFQGKYTRFSNLSPEVYQSYDSED